jgi:hypothetical protein
MLWTLFLFGLGALIGGAVMWLAIMIAMSQSMGR